MLHSHIYISELEEVVRELTLVYDHEDTQEGGTSRCAEGCAQQHRRGILHDDLAREEKHGYEMQRAVYRYHPAEDC